MVSVEAEVSKYKNCKDRDELVGLIKQYKDLALQHASNLTLAGQYSMVAQKLHEMCDKLPAPKLIVHSANGRPKPVKTADITNEEQARIDAAWQKKTRN